MDISLAVTLHSGKSSSFCSSNLHVVSLVHLVAVSFVLPYPVYTVTVAAVRPKHQLK